MGVMSSSYPDQVARLSADEVRQLADRLAAAARRPAPAPIRWWQAALAFVLGSAGIVAILGAGVAVSELLG